MANASTFIDSFYFFRYVYVRTVHVSVVSTEARRLGPLEIQTQVVVTSLGSGVLPSDPL